MFECQMFFLFVYIIFIIACIIGFNKIICINSIFTNSNAIDQKILRTAIQVKIRSIISDPNRFSNEFHMFDIFKDYYIKSVFDEISKNVEEHGAEYLKCKIAKIDKKQFSKLLLEELNNQTTTQYFHDCYIKWIQNNIKEAQRLEDEAVKYHNTFGIEPEGDPILHPKEKNNDGIITDEKDTNVEDLLDTGTIEDLE